MQGIPAHASHYRRRWEAEGYQTEHVGGGSSRCCGMGGRVRSHRSRRRPVRWRSGPTCAQVNRLFACKGVGGVGLGRSGPECRWWRGRCGRCGRCGRRGRCAHPAASRVQVRMEGCGGEWFGVPVPRLFLFVGAVHPNCRHYTSSVRVQRHVTGAPPRNGCSAPVLVAVVGVAGVFWAWVVCLDCLPLGALRGAFVAPHVVVPQKCRT